MQPNLAQGLLVADGRPQGRQLCPGKVSISRRNANGARNQYAGRVPDGQGTIVEIAPKLGLVNDPICIANRLSEITATTPMASASTWRTTSAKN